MICICMGAELCMQENKRKGMNDRCNHRYTHEDTHIEGQENGNNSCTDENFWCEKTVRVSDIYTQLNAYCVPWKKGFELPTTVEDLVTMQVETRGASSRLAHS